MNQTLDYLFIDEAGQVSLANTISMATSSKNLVLIGDQMQLSQPIRGTHEGYAKLSSLDYILEDKDTISPEQGIFLRETRRLNKEICKYISDSFYDSRLIPHEVTKTRSVKLGLNNIKDQGIFFIPTDHVGNSQRSDEGGYENRYQWGDNWDYGPSITWMKTNIQSYSRWDMSSEQMKYAEVQAIAGGVTAVQGSPSSGTDAWDSMLSRHAVMYNFGQDGMYTCAVCGPTDSDYNANYIIEKNQNQHKHYNK